MLSIKQMPNDARVWVFQSNKILSDVEVINVNKAGLNFIEGWKAHGASLKASFDILYNRFIIIAVDEKQASVGGCSLDSSIHFIKELEKQFNLNLLDRMQVAYRNGNEILSCNLSEFEKLAVQNIVNESTIVFNNMISSKNDFDNKWEVNLKQSWQSRVLQS
jgi:hypothetical protein